MSEIEEMVRRSEELRAVLAGIVPGPDEHVVYLVECPLTGEVRYVGVTEKPIVRFAQHLQARANAKPYRRKAWFDGLAALGLSPRFRVITHGLTRIAANLEEQIAIRFLSERGVKLFNVIHAVRK